MEELQTFIGPNGLPTQLFKGKVYQLFESDPRYFKRGSNIRLHVAVWTFFNGKPLKKHHIHHKDENKHNNNPDNLEMIPAGEHIRLHTIKRLKENPEWFQRLAKSGQDKAALWSKTEEGLSFRRKHAKEVLFKYHEHLFKKEAAKVCEQCGKEYTTTNLSAITSRFCSNACKSEWRRKSGVDNEIRKCLLCNSEFTANHYTKNKYCSRSCSSKHGHKRRRELKNTGRE